MLFSIMVYYKLFNIIPYAIRASLVAPLVTESACNVGDQGLIPGLGRSPGEGKGYALQYSGLENSMDCIVHGVAKSRTRLSDFHFCLTSLSCSLSIPLLIDI